MLRNAGELEARQLGFLAAQSDHCLDPLVFVPAIKPYLQCEGINLEVVLSSRLSSAYAPIATYILMEAAHGS